MKLGDIVLTTSGFDVVTSVDITPNMMSYEVLRTKSGLEVNVTGNHPILTKDGWKRVLHLNIGDEVVIYDDKEGCLKHDTIVSIKTIFSKNITVYSIRTNKYNDFIINNLVFSQ